MKIIFEFDNLQEARDMLDLKEQYEKAKTVNQAMEEQEYDEIIEDEKPKKKFKIGFLGGCEE